MPPPLPTFQEGEDRSTGEALMNLALTLMGEVKNDLGSMKAEWRSEVKNLSDKLDKLGDERREEAREQGEFDARLKALEQFKVDTEAGNRAIRMLAFSSLFAAGGALMLAVLKLLGGHPEVIR